jgi:hypothetical protein
MFSIDFDVELTCGTMIDDSALHEAFSVKVQQDIRYLPYMTKPGENLPSIVYIFQSNWCDGERVD